MLHCRPLRCIRHRAGCMALTLLSDIWHLNILQIDLHQLHEGSPWPSGLRRRSSSQDYLPLTAKVVGSRPARSKTLCEKVSSYLRKDGGSTQSELFWGIPPPIKLEKSSNNLKCVKMTLNPIQFDCHVWREFNPRDHFFTNKYKYRKRVVLNVGVKKSLCN